MSRALALVALAFAACSAPEPAPRLGAPPTAPAARALDVAFEGPRDGDGPLLVLLHGYGAPGRDLVPLGRELRARIPELRVALPAAPIDMGHGRAWWPISLAERPSDRSRERPDGLPAARADLQAALDELSITPSRTVVAGFSQGGMLATDFGLRADPPLAGIASLSGGPVDAETWIARAGSAPPIFLSHGRQDPLLTYAAADRLQARLSEGGAQVTWVPFDGGHAIPPEVVDQLTAFLRETLAGDR
ncbi:MAG: dienelactone hydrolase family protein [Sandaracinaceae bacterium]|nr:dienelactone hydrolase family protein [Sandaracinaceae bacterium]